MGNSMPQKSLHFTSATGLIPHTFQNDYMFRGILQRNKIVLIGLTSSLLHIPPENITDISIENAIQMGEDFDSKTFILDIHVLINRNMYLNLEMQVVNEQDWSDRSLSYLCRQFDNLYSGDEYSKVKGVHHVGILNFNAFKDSDEFYSTYYLMNDNQHIYSSKFRLSVLNLRQIDKATEEDKEWKIDYWARLFAAKTWEDLSMIAENDIYLSEASESLYILNQDKIFAEQCRAREDALRREKRNAEMMEKLLAEQERARKDAERKEKRNAEMMEKYEELKVEAEELKEETADLKQKNDEKDREIQELKKLLMEHGIDA